jgi:hypothetical protein
MVERRRPVMQAYADYVTSRSESATVVPFEGKRRLRSAAYEGST